MLPRLRRLASDLREVDALVGHNPRIRLIEAEGDPPERYVFELEVRGLTPQPDGEPRVADVFRAEIFLPLDYPRRPPFCRMLTPVFHPNIDPQKICVGDHWSSGQSLAQVAVRIAEMIAFQCYNVKSPLNARAARWAEEHIAELPLDSADLTAGL